MFTSGAPDLQSLMQLLDAAQMGWWKADFRTGDWQGFEGVNLDLVIDLGKQQTINKITAGFMQDENAWIFFPQKMQPCAFGRRAAFYLPITRG